MSVVLGLDCKLYYGTAGSTAATELTNVKDVTLALEKGESDTTTRGSNGWTTSVGTLKNGSLEFDMVWDDDDTGFNAIKDSYFDDTAIAFLILDGASGNGLDADFSILKFTRTESLTEAVTVSISAKPTYSTRAPSWTEASS